MSFFEQAVLPNAQDFAWHQRVLKEATESLGAAWALDGPMSDKPVIERPKSILARAQV